MTKSRVVVLVAVIAAAISVWWWRRSRGDEPTNAPAVMQPTIAGPATVVRLTPTATAHLKVSVRDAKGPVANAAVRLASKDGEVVVLRAGGDGVATSGALEPGSWRIVQCYGIDSILEGGISRRARESARGAVVRSLDLAELMALEDRVRPQLKWLAPKVHILSAEVCARYPQKRLDGISVSNAP